MKYKKTKLLGTIVAITTPIAAVVSCGDDDSSNNIKIDTKPTDKHTPTNINTNNTNGGSAHVDPHVSTHQTDPKPATDPVPAPIHTTIPVPVPAPIHTTVPTPTATGNPPTTGNPPATTVHTPASHSVTEQKTPTSERAPMMMMKSMYYGYTPGAPWIYTRKSNLNGATFTTQIDLIDFPDFKVEDLENSFMNDENITWKVTGAFDKTKLNIEQSVTLNAVNAAGESPDYIFKVTFVKRDITTNLAPVNDSWLTWSPLGDGYSTNAENIFHIEALNLNGINFSSVTLQGGSISRNANKKANKHAIGRDKAVAQKWYDIFQKNFNRIMIDPHDTEASKFFKSKTSGTWDLLAAMNPSASVGISGTLESWISKVKSALGDVKSYLSIITNMTITETSSTSDTHNPELAIKMVNGDKECYMMWEIRGTDDAPTFDISLASPNWRSTHDSGGGIRTDLLFVPRGARSAIQNLPTTSLLRTNEWLQNTTFEPFTNYGNIMNYINNRFQ